MPEHMQEWLNAYLDDELNERQHASVEQHLAVCQACRAELEALRLLSQEVQRVPLPQELPTAERFAAQLMLRLPRHPAQPARNAEHKLSWWLVPATLLAAWAFVQAVFWLNSGVWAVGQAGLLGEAAAWLAPAPHSTGAVTGFFQWLGVLPAGNAQQAAAISESIGWGMLLQLVLEGGLAVLYLAWLVTWWQRRQGPPAGLVPVTNQKNG